MPKFKNKNAFLGYFGARLMKKDGKFEITPLNLFNQKIRKKNKIP